MTQLTGFGIGRILALVGLVLVVVLVVIGHMALLPIGILFALAFLAILL